MIFTAEAVGRTAALARLAITTMPFPLVFLVQIQLEAFDRASDVQWFGRLMSELVGFLHARL